jgi:hypothetical protein
LEYEGSTGQLQIMNIMGQVVKRIPFNGNETQFDVSELTNGNYIAVIQTDGQQSNSMKFIIQH